MLCLQGVGYSVLLAQGLLGLYCCVPIAWLFIFFRDSFITHNNMFRWTDCRCEYHSDKKCNSHPRPFICCVFFIYVCNFEADYLK